LHTDENREHGELTTKATGRAFASSLPTSGSAVSFTGDGTLSPTQVRFSKVDGTQSNKKVARHFNPNKCVKITFKNTSDDHIKVTWYDKDGNIQLSDDGHTPALDTSFPPNALQEVWMEPHELQKFRFQRGTKIREDEYVGYFPTCE
jgi:hypothetical protein